MAAPDPIAVERAMYFSMLGIPDDPALSLAELKDATAGGANVWKAVKAAGATSGGSGSSTPLGLLPTGISSPKDYTAIDGPVINAGTATTNFFATPGSLATTTLSGLSCVRSLIQSQQGYKAGVNITSDPTTGKYFILVDFAWARQSGYGGSINELQHLLIADGQNLTGATSVINLPFMPESKWVTLAIPVGSLGDVESIGVINDVGNYQTGGQALYNYWRNIRWANQTEVDQALQKGAVLIPPAYVPGVTQELKQPIAGKTRVNLDPAVAWIDGFGGIRHIREWGIVETGLTEVSAEMARAFSQMLPGQTLMFPPKGIYWVDKPLRVPSGVRIDFNGSILFTGNWRGGNNNVQDPMIEVNGTDIQLIRPRIIGYREDLTNGDVLSNIAGTPTSTGGEKLLDSQGETCAKLTTNGRAPWHARYPLVMIPTSERAAVTTAYPTFAYGNVWGVYVYDTAQVANDCIIEIVNTVTGAVEASRTLTLTGVSVEYMLAWEPTDIEAQVSVRVRKATATANVIHVEAIRSFGFTDYDGSHDSASGILIQNAKNVLIDEWLVEGQATDGIDSTSAANKNIVVRNGISRANSRQGVSCSQGGATFQNLTIIGANRSGVDIEPYALNWLVDGIVLRNLRIVGCENYAIAMANWAGIANITIDGIISERCLVGTLIGGGRGGAIRNITSDGSISISGQRLRGGNITCSTFAITNNKAIYAPDTQVLGVASGSGSSSNVVAVASTALLAVGQRVLIAPSTPDPIRRITAIAGLNVTFDGAAVSWTAGNFFYSPSAYYDSRDNSFSGLTLTAVGPPAVTGVLNKVSDVNGTARVAVNSNLAIFNVVDGAMGNRNGIRDTFTKQFGRTYPADRNTEPPFIHGGLNLRGQALHGLKGISGDRRTGTITVADATLNSGRNTSASLDLGFRGLSVVLHLNPSVGGTGAVLSVQVETSQNNVNWYPVASFQDATDFGLHDTMVVRFAERYLRIVTLLTGSSSPSGSAVVTAVYSLPSYNTAGQWTGASSTTATVAFPSKGGPAFNSLAVSVWGSNIGSLTPGTYYYRMGGRTREHGPVSWLPEQSVTLSGAQNTVGLFYQRWLDGLGYFTDGFSLLRGTSAGTYNTRFDVLAKAGVELFTTRADIGWFLDKGASIAVETPTNHPDFPDTYPTLSPKLTATDETGLEIDNTYKVFTMPAYTAITKRADGFDVTFAAAQTAFDWFIVR